MTIELILFANFFRYFHYFLIILDAIKVIKNSSKSNKDLNGHKRKFIKKTSKALYAIYMWLINYILSKIRLNNFRLVYVILSWFRLG